MSPLPRLAVVIDNGFCSSIKDPIDSDKLAVKFLERFYDTPVTIGQLVLFNAENINFEVVVKEMKGWYIDFYHIGLYGH